MDEHEAERLARREWELGFAHQRDGRLGYALQAYRRSIALFPTAEAYTFLGWALSFLNRYEEAVESCQRAIALDPDYGNPYNDIGAYLIEMGRWEEAEPWFKLALNAPRYEARAFAHFNQGRVHERFGRYHAALACYRTAQTVSPDFEEAQRAYMALLARMN